MAPKNEQSTQQGSHDTDTRGSRGDSQQDDDMNSSSTKGSRDENR